MTTRPRGDAAGSYKNIDEATNFTNQTLQHNQDKVDNVVNNKITRNAEIYQEFNANTGYEVYRENALAEPAVRPTRNVIAVIRYDPESEKGYVLVTSYPTNKGRNK